MDKPKQISFYDNPEALGLLECIRGNLDCLSSNLEFIRRNDAINSAQPEWIKDKLMKLVEFAERLEKLFDVEKSDDGE